MISIIAPKSEVIVAEVLGQLTVIVPQKEAITLEVGQQGPAGPAGPMGPVGPAGPTGGVGTNHALLLNLDYDHSGHTGFQKEIPYDPDLKALLV